MGISLDIVSHLSPMLHFKMLKKTNCFAAWDYYSFTNGADIVDVCAISKCLVPLRGSLFSRDGLMIDMEARFSTSAPSLLLPRDYKHLSGNSDFGLFLVL